MNKPVIKVGVISDVVCPWCYIGKRRLEKAIEKLSHKYHFEVEYFPFELNNQIPDEGVDQREYLSKKFGGPDRYEQATAHTTSVAATEGLFFNFQAQKVAPNTRNAHRLIQLAREDDKQLQLVEAFFKAYFTDGVDLSRIENLVAICVNNGMDGAKVEDFLKSETGVTEIEMAEQQLHETGITGVPFYVINERYGISGAQPTDVFIKAFEDVQAEAVAASDAGSCDISDENC